MIKTFKIITLRIYIPRIMKLGMENYELKLYTVYINGDPVLNFTYFTAIQNLAKVVSVLILGPDIR